MYQDPNANLLFWQLRRFEEEQRQRHPHPRSIAAPSMGRLHRHGRRAVALDARRLLAVAIGKAARL
jgi:hypothetical protein